MEFSGNDITKVKAPTSKRNKQTNKQKKATKKQENKTSKASKDVKKKAILLSIFVCYRNLRCLVIFESNGPTCAWRESQIIQFP